MAETTKEVQIAFRVSEELRNKFYAAIKRQGLDIADVMRPVVERWANSTESQQELLGKTLESQHESLIVRLPSGRKLSKPLQELLPKLERILTRPDTRSVLRVMVNKLSLPGGSSEVDGGAKTDKGKAKR